MTVCVAIAVYDGVVFAADSASSLTGIDANGIPVVSNVYQHGNKVFNLIKGLPLLSMTCGLGNIGRAPIAALTKELRKRMCSEGDPLYVDKSKYSVEEIAQKAKQFILDEKYSAIVPPPPGDFEYWIGGYSSGSELHEIWKFGLSGGNIYPPCSINSPGDVTLTWSGQPEAITRLVMGFSPQLQSVLAQSGATPENINTLLGIIGPALQAPLVHAAMPIQDAIHLADFLVDVTKRFVRFLPGADTVGGDTDIATVTRYEHFKWIKRKHYYPAALNPLETDHV